MYVSGVCFRSYMAVNNIDIHCSVQGYAVVTKDKAYGLTHSWNIGYRCDTFVYVDMATIFSKHFFLTNRFWAFSELLSVRATRT